MKKIITLVALAAMLAVSCQNEITPDKGNSNNSVEGKLTATIVQTKVSYNETSEMNLQPAWEVGDEIIGFDDAGKTYTLTVASVSAETATLSGTVPDGNLHLIYKSGAKASDISSKTLAIDYTAQAGDKTMPAVMLADGTVTDGACDFAFTNAGAIIGISAVNGVPSGSKVTKITISGENLSAATVAFSGSALALTATEKAYDAISVSGLNLTVTDANGTLSSPVFLAVPAGAKIEKVSLPIAKEPETMPKPNTTLQEGVDYVTIGGIKWAKWNVGASSETEYGWYFPWGGTEGYIRYADTWQLAEASFVEFSYTPSSARTTSASDYMYVKTQAFITGHSFEWKTALYHSGSSDVTGWTKYIPSNCSSYWSGEGSPDNKSVLDAEDDAVQVNWGGNWRMPTYDEVVALSDACGGATAPVALSSANPGQGIYWVSAEQSYITDYTGVAGLLFCDGTSKLFFPAAGGGINDTINGLGQYCRYWTNTLRLSMPYTAYYLYFLGSEFNPKGFYSRFCGISVRPVLD